MNGDGFSIVSVLGLWLSVVTVAAALAFASYRWGQARERQQQQALLAQARQAQAEGQARAVSEAQQVQRAQAIQEQRALRSALGAALNQAQADVLQAAALPLLLLQPSLAVGLESAETDGAADSAPGSAELGQPGHWQLSQLNPAAQALWPTLHAGDALHPVLQQLSGPADPAAPPAAASTSVGQVLQAALPGLAAGASVESGGWRLLRLSGTVLQPHGLLLAASGPGWAASAGAAPVVSSLPATPAAGREPSAVEGAKDNATNKHGHSHSTAASGESEHFSFTLSHDLRAPIRVVEGFTRIVKEDYGTLLDRVGNDHLDRVLGAAARMNQMIDALLTLARLSSQPLAHQPVNLSQLAQYVVEDLRRQNVERVAQINIEAGLTAVGDPTLLRLVLENLLGNAWKYSARCTVTHIEFKRESVNGRPAFVVRDQGAGFDMRSADRLFGLFQRLHSANDFPGTGVGLASVQRIVRRHGGEIWAEAEPGRGASFHFTLTH